MNNHHEKPRNSSQWKTIAKAQYEDECRNAPAVSFWDFVELSVRILREAARRCSLDDSEVAKDIIYVRNRATHEGIVFFTETLPALGKVFDKCLSLDLRLKDELAFTHFDKVKVDKKTGYPRFMKGFFQLVFDDSGHVGQLADVETRCYDPKGPRHHVRMRIQDGFRRQVEAVRAIRQICYLAYKLDVGHDKSKVTAVLDNFVETDNSLPALGDRMPLSDETLCAIASARLLLLRCLQGFDPEDITPSHGPGAVATGEKAWKKMNFRRFYRLLDAEYSYPEYFFYSYTHLADCMSQLEELDELEFAEAKVCLVPKDSRGPRIISEEPLEIQWIQQGLGRALMKYIESAATPMRGFVNFTNQEINRSLARAFSIWDPNLPSSMRMVTLDMKDASDRVSSWLVDLLFPEPLKSKLFATRSQYTKLPDGRRLELKKFAPMGSALCFPVEAMTFWALAVGTADTFIRFRDMKSPTPVYVYGDDLIMPNDIVERVFRVFEELHLRFNEGKCCIGRFFRESCGLDAFQGEEVTPIRIKHQLLETLSPPATLSWVSYHNSLYDKGYVDAAQYVRERLTKVFGPIPFTNTRGKHQLAYEYPDWDNADVLGHNLAQFGRRYNKRLQVVEIRVPSVSSRVFRRGKPNWSEILRLHKNWGNTSGDMSGAFQACRHTVPHSENVRGSWLDAMSFCS